MSTQIFVFVFYSGNVRVTCMRQQNVSFLIVQWAAHQPTPMCQHFTMELEPYRIVTKSKIVQINLTFRGRLTCCPLYLKLGKSSNDPPHRVGQRGMTDYVYDDNYRLKTDERLTISWQRLKMFICVITKPTEIRSPIVLCYKIHYMAS